MSNTETIKSRISAYNHGYSEGIHGGSGVMPNTFTEPNAWANGYCAGRKASDAIEALPRNIVPVSDKLLALKDDIIDLLINHLSLHISIGISEADHKKVDIILMFDAKPICSSSCALI